ncbi:MAG: heterodisulfide reductase-related iron-sulfur binding cluster [Methanomassiliicoccales archaeon]
MPCHLKRTLGPHVMDYATEIVQNLPGVRLVEMEEPDRCCGGGGGVLAGHPEVSLTLAKAKVMSALEAKAEVLVAPCPFCVINIRRAGGLEVKDFVPFLNEHLK